MPQIPGLPTVDPVNRPMVSPAQAGIPGATVAGLGQDIQGMASAQMEVEAHIIAAQRQLEAKQGELALDKHMEQTYADLSKTTSTEDAQAVYEHSQKEAEIALAPYGKDPRVARALDIYRQQQDIHLLHTVNARKASIVTDQDKAANSLLGEKSMQEAITAARSGGDPSVARTKFELQLHSSVAHGTMTPADVAVEMQKWDHDLQKGVLEAAINSPNPAERKQTIEQLKSGKGKLDLSLLDDAARNNLYRHAVEVDHALTNDEKEHSLNASLNAIHTAFQSPEYANNYSGQLKALGDPEFLRSHGIVAADGSPDFEMAGRLRSYVNADHATNQVALEEQADKHVNEWSKAITEGNYSKAYGIVRQNINAIQAPEKNKGLAERLVGATRSAANRTDEDVLPRTSAIAMTRWLDRFDAGEDYNNPTVKAELFGDPHLKAEAIVSIGRYARTQEDKVVRGGLALATERIKKNFPTSQKALEDAFVQGKLKPKPGEKLEDAISQFEQLQLDSYSQAREDLAAWTSQQQQLAAAGKRPALTQDDIVQAGEDIAKHRTPTVEKQLDAIHADRTKLAPSHGKKPAVMEQYSESRKQYRYSTDGGTTWQQGRAPNQR